MSNYLAEITFKCEMYEDYKKLTEHGFSSTASIYRCLRNLLPDPIDNIFENLYESQLKKDSE